VLSNASLVIGIIWGIFSIYDHLHKPKGNPRIPAVVSFIVLMVCFGMQAYESHVSQGIAEEAIKDLNTSKEQSIKYENQSNQLKSQFKTEISRAITENKLPEAENFLKIAIANYQDDPDFEKLRQDVITKKEAQKNPPDYTSYGERYNNLSNADKEYANIIIRAYWDQLGRRPNVGELDEWRESAWLKGKAEPYVVLASIIEEDKRNGRVR
jgi:hypothetical protein